MKTGFKIICRFDEAIDADAMSTEAIRAFRDTGEISHLRFVEDVRPTVFHCRRLKISEMQSVQSNTSDADIFVGAFLRGVVRVDDLRREDGGRMSWERPDETRAVTMKEAEERFDPGEVMEVGAAIYARSILGKGRPAAWPQPATSALAVGALARHRAEQKMASVVSSARSKDDPAAPQAETPGG